MVLGVKKRHYLILAVVMAAALMVPTLLHAAQEAHAAEVATFPISNDLREDAIHQEVDFLREKREKVMPYLDRSYIRSMINPEKIEAKGDFLARRIHDLENMIERAKQVHTPAKAAHESISLSNRRMIHALRKLFPEITFEKERRGGSLAGTGFFGSDWRWSIRQPIFRGGVLWNSFLQEKANREAAENEYDKVIQELVRDLSEAFFEYQRAQKVTENQKEVIEKLKRQVEISKKKFEKELISEIEHLNVESLFSQLEFDHETSIQELELAKLDLQKFLDLSMSDTVRLQENYSLTEFVKQNGNGNSKEGIPSVFREEKKSVPDLGKLIDLSYGNRSELQVEAAKLQAARLGERIRWGGMLPTADLTMELGRAGERFTGPTVPEAPKFDLKNEWRLMLEVNWNLAGNKVSYTHEQDERAPAISQFLGGRGSTTQRDKLSVGVLDGLEAFVDVKQSEVDKLNQVVELENAEKQVLQDVKEAYYNYQKALIRMASTVKRVKWRNRLLDLSEHRLGRKEIEISEYVQAEVDLLQEKTDLHSALRDYYSAKAGLNYAVGTHVLLNTKE